MIKKDKVFSTQTSVDVHSSVSKFLHNTSKAPFICFSYIRLFCVGPKYKVLFFFHRDWKMNLKIKWIMNLNVKEFRDKWIYGLNE